MRISYLVILFLSFVISSCGGGGSYSNGPIETATTKQDARRLVAGFEREVKDFSRLAERMLNHPEDFEEYAPEIEKIDQRMGEYKEKIEEARSNGLISDEEMAEIEIKMAILGNDLIEKISNTRCGKYMGF